MSIFKKKKLSLVLIALLQALGLTVYCGLIGAIIWRGNKWLGPIKIFLGPTLFLVFFVASALICSLIGLGYPVYLFWEKKQRVEAIKLVAYMSLWLAFFTLLIFIALIIL